MEFLVPLVTNWKSLINVREGSIHLRCYYPFFYICIRPYYKNIFEILYVFSEKSGKSISQFEVLFLVHSVVIYASSVNESIFPATWEEYLANCWRFGDILFVWFLRNNVRIFLLTHVLIKIMSMGCS